jgi:hypothetical protein
MEIGPDAPEFTDERHSALLLRRAENEGDYLDKLVWLLWAKSGVATRSFYVPRRPGPAGAAAAWIKRLLWRALAYQHDRVAFKQNTVNAQLSAAVEFLLAEQREAVRNLQARVSELEDALRRARKEDGPAPRES